MTTTDQAWQHVHLFQLRVDNLGRVGDLRSQMHEMAKSNDWRDYTSALGRQRWRAAEFDYFLIDCGVTHQDARRAIEWSRTGTELAALMDPAAEPDQRRPITEAAKDWRGNGIGNDFLGEARRLGWLTDDDATKPVVSTRALEQARTGVTYEVRARANRTERLSPTRRQELNSLADVLLTELASSDEQRYIIDRLRAATRGQRRPADVRADGERLGWNVAALAKHWGVARSTANEWIRDVRDAAEA